LKHLGEYLQKLGSLKNLNLCFADCFRITDQGLENLRQNLKSLSGCLVKISLNFSGCIKISDSGVEGISRGLREFMALEEVVLEFDGCPKITKSGEEKVKMELRWIKPLKRAEVSFGGRSEMIDFGENGKKWKKQGRLFLVLMGVLFLCFVKPLLRLLLEILRVYIDCEEFM